MSRTKNNVMKYLVDTYIYNGYDILNFKISKDNALTYHQIIKQKDLKALGFPTTMTLENGIALTTYSHSYLHLIEDFAPDIFYQINKIILLITRQWRLPTPDERSLLQILLEAFEYRMQEYYRISSKYLKRVLAS